MVQSSRDPLAVLVGPTTDLSGAQLTPVGSRVTPGSTIGTDPDRSHQVIQSFPGLTVQVEISKGDGLDPNAATLLAAIAEEPKRADRSRRLDSRISPLAREFEALNLNLVYRDHTNGGTECREQRVVLGADRFTDQHPFYHAQFGPVNITVVLTSPAMSLGPLPASRRAA